ncbi:histidine phosphatase family protein [Kitasatospora sp. NBC_01287]|uniref:histidine phosphatase family protein n=1 Tax=Kitasatospora sp. NBC_01287 TaxID=2903573 RepID=UPI002255429F|nr:histidine phosphatase family protein [Kitasatospora sp. NBC_01287]MCX4745069.1 histidine phosphatase family protein [Kitasatospora sp. NBC_01287]
MTRIWCLRHGHARNIETGAAGALPEAPLTALGRRQVAAAARELAGERPAQVYASPARRARQTAAALGPAVTVLPGLAEVGVGAAEGSTDPAVLVRTAEVLRSWVVAKDLAPRVADGEDGHTVVARVRGAFEAVAHAHPGGTVALVGHVASLTAGLSALCGLGAEIWGAPLPPAVPFLVCWDGVRWSCSAWPTG